MTLGDKKDLKNRNYECNYCQYITSNKYDYNKHTMTAKHKIAAEGNTQETKKDLKNRNYECIYCQYITNNKTKYEVHITTAKHKINEYRQQIGNKKGQKNRKYNKNDFLCNCCNKQYKSRVSLWKHNKKCISIEENGEPEEIKIPTLTPEIFMEVLNQSKELQNVIIEQNKKLLELTSKPNMVNSNNKNFNLQFFLNETCKDAMNIADFVNSLTLTIEDFEATGRLGYIDGISRIIINGLKGLTTEKLPLHCTDLKRETIYIKDNDVWEKENQDKQRVKWAIDNVATKNLQKYKDWKELYPDCEINNTPANHKSVEILLSALGGVGKQQEDKYREKIMKNVFKEVVLDKK